MQQGDHIDPRSGRRLIPRPLPPWYGTAARTIPPVPVVLVVEAPAPMPAYRWAWTEDGFIRVAV